MDGKNGGGNRSCNINFDEDYILLRTFYCRKLKVRSYDVSSKSNMNFRELGLSVNCLSCCASQVS